MHRVQRILCLSQLHKGVGIDGGKLASVGLQQSITLGTLTLSLSQRYITRVSHSLPPHATPLHANWLVRSYSICQVGAVIWRFLLPICGEKGHTAILVTCLGPLRPSMGLLALSTSGLPTKALWLATESHPRAAMASKLNIPGDMVAVQRSISRCCCPFAGFRRQPHLHLR